MDSTAVSPSLRPERLFWALQLGGWALFGAGMFAAGLSLATFRDAVILKGPLTLLGFLVSLGLRAVYRRMDSRRLPPAAEAVVAVPLSFCAAAVWMAGYHAALAFAAAAVRGSVLKGSVSAAALARFPDFTNTIYYSFVLIAWSVLYFGVKTYLSLAHERARLARAEALAREARLTALRLQLNPHFLFNTLNAISTLVAESRGEEANRMLARLAGFLRATLDRADGAEIPLEEEVEFVRRYLEIEEVRFGDRLRVTLDVRADALPARVPPLILQPLVENALRHAVVAREEGGEIAVRAARRAGWVTLAVEDDGPGMDSGAAEPRGIGLANTRQRLAELYGGDAELAIGRSAGGGVAASIRIPFRAVPGGARS